MANIEKLTAAVTTAMQPIIEDLVVKITREQQVNQAELMARINALEATIQTMKTEGKKEARKPAAAKAPADETPATPLPAGVTLATTVRAQFLNAYAVDQELRDKFLARPGVAEAVTASRTSGTLSKKAGKEETDEYRKAAALVVYNHLSTSKDAEFEAYKANYEKLKKASKAAGAPAAPPAQ